MRCFAIIALALCGIAFAANAGTYTIDGDSSVIFLQLHTPNSHSSEISEHVSGKITAEEMGATLYFVDSNEGVVLSPDPLELDIGNGMKATLKSPMLHIHAGPFDIGDDTTASRTANATMAVVSDAFILMDSKMREHRVDSMGALSTTGVAFVERVGGQGADNSVSISYSSDPSRGTLYFDTGSVEVEFFMHVMIVLKGGEVEFPPEKNSWEKPGTSIPSFGSGNEDWSRTPPSYGSGNEDWNQPPPSYGRGNEDWNRPPPPPRPSSRRV